MTYAVKYVPFDTDVSKNGKVWTLAQSEMLKPNRTNDKVTEKTTFEALVSDEFFYVSFTCEDSFLKADYKNLNEPLFDQDVVEIFIGDKKTPNKYLELEFNINNAVFSAMITNNDLKLKRDYLNGLGIRVSSNVSKNGYDLIAEIPVKELVNLGLFAFNEEFAFGVYRINLMQDGTYEFSALSPTLADKPDYAFHVYQNFGTVIFEKK